MISFSGSVAKKIFGKIVAKVVMKCFGVTDCHTDIEALQIFEKDGRTYAKASIQFDAPTDQMERAIDKFA